MMSFYFRGIYQLFIRRKPQSTYRSNIRVSYSQRIYVSADWLSTKLEILMLEPGYWKLKKKKNERK